jgi:hypothetical protein
LDYNIHGMTALEAGATTVSVVQIVDFLVGASCGVILLRLGGESPQRDNRRAVEAIRSRTDWAGHFSVVTNDRIRMRPLPSAPVQREEPNDG